MEREFDEVEAVENHCNSLNDKTKILKFASKTG